MQQTSIPAVTRPAEIHESAAAPFLGILWILKTPDSIDKTLALLEKNPELRITLALSEEFSKILQVDIKSRILQLSKNGQVELALRLPKDPVLPLLVQPRYFYPQDYQTQLLSSLRAHQGFWEEDSYGLTLTAGAINQEGLKLLQSNPKTSWIAIGVSKWADKGSFPSHPVKPEHPESPFYSWENLTLAMVKLLDLNHKNQAELETLAEKLAEEKTAVSQLYVLDELHTPLSSRAALLFLERLAKIRKEGRGHPLGTFRDILQRDGSELFPWTYTEPTSWLGDLSPWKDKPEKRVAWQLLKAAREALEKYQNSGRAALSTLDLAFQEIFTAESGNYFFVLGEDQFPLISQEKERLFKATLANVYRLIGENIPSNLDWPLKSMKLQEELLPMASTSTAVPSQSSLRRAQGRWEPQWGATSGTTEQGHPQSGSAKEVQNLQEKILPRGAPVGRDVEIQDNQLIWDDPEGDHQENVMNLLSHASSNLPMDSVDLTRFELTWTEDQLRFSFRFKSLPNPEKTPYGFSYPLIDLYLDLNSRVGAGFSQLLPERNVKLKPRDAWEYAMTLTGWGGYLFRSSVTGKIEMVQKLAPHTDSSKSTVTVTLPRSLLKGNPMNWGYLVLVMAADKTRLGPPPAPIPMREPASNHAAVEIQTVTANPREEFVNLAPPVIDLLTSGMTQNEMLEIYRLGQTIHLPAVRVR